MQNMPNSL